MNVYDELAFYQRLVGKENVRIIDGLVCLSKEGVSRLILENRETSLDKKKQQLDNIEMCTGIKLH